MGFSTIIEHFGKTTLAQSEESLTGTHGFAQLMDILHTCRFL